MYTRLATVLQCECVAVCCSVLQCVAVSYSVLQCVAAALSRARGLTAEDRTRYTHLATVLQCFAGCCRCVAGVLQCRCV